MQVRIYSHLCRLLDISGYVKPRPPPDVSSDHSGCIQGTISPQLAVSRFTGILMSGLSKKLRFN